MEMKNPLLRRALLYLEDGEWGKADDYCEQVLDREPESAEAYVVKLMARLKVDKIDALGATEKSYEQWHSYQNACRFADEDLKKELNAYVQKAKEYAKQEEIRRQKELEEQRKAEHERRQTALYNDGLRYSKENATLDQLRKAQQCFAQILDFSDAKEKMKSCKERIVVLENERKFWVYKQIEEEKKKKRKIWIAVALIAVCVFVGIVLWTGWLQDSNSRKEEQIEKNLEKAIFCGTQMDTVTSTGQALMYVTEMTEYSRTFEFNSDGSITIHVIKRYGKAPFVTKNGEKQWDEIKEYTEEARWGDVRVSISGNATVKIDGTVCELTLDDDNVPISFKMGNVTYTVLEK